MVELRLYVAGKMGRSARTAEGIQQMMAALTKVKYSLLVVDVLEDPQAAIEDQVFATPTLLRYAPPPARKVMGDLSDQAKVLDVLELTHNLVS